MDYRIVNIGDIHLESKHDRVLAKADQLAAAICNGMQGECHLVAILNGDFVYAGDSDQFTVAKEFVDKLTGRISEIRPGDPFTVCLMPGNHDCNFSGDQAARSSLLKDLRPVRPAPSIESVVLSPLSNYFQFVDALGLQDSSISRDYPYVRQLEVVHGKDRILIGLLNSSWMSDRREAANSLAFPLDLLPTAGDYRDCLVSVVAMHHPLNWFRQPDTMRKLEGWITESADILLTGHEHVASAASEHTPDQKKLMHLKGGSLQNSPHDDSSVFHILDVSGTNRNTRHRACSWNTDRYESSIVTVYGDIQNIGAASHATSFRPSFEAKLNDPELPVGRHQKGMLLQDIFVFPDFIEYTSVVGEDERKRIRGENIVNEILNNDRVLITGSEKSGKTALAKQTMLRLRSEGYIPVLLNGIDVARKGDNDESVRKWLGSVLADQYNALDADAFQQNCRGRRILIVDDFERVYDYGATASDIANTLSRATDFLIVLCSEDLIICESQGGIAQFTGLPGFRKLQICELGEVRVEELARRWIGCDHVGLSLTPSERDNRAREMAVTLRTVLSAEVIPHHPWIVIVLIHQSQETDSLAVRSGSYGHLYQAILTAALTTSSRGVLDLNGKFSYLSALAFELHQTQAAQLQEKQAHEFHRQYCESLDIHLDFESTVRGLVETGVLRRDSSGLSFAAKYSYCFFLAWYIHDHLSEQSQQDLVVSLCSHLYHTESANTLLFLSHLAPDREVLEMILKRAAAIFPTGHLSNLIDDLAPLDKLSQFETKTVLPGGDPDANRKLEQERRDDKRQLQRSSDSFDGRNIVPAPAAPKDEITKIVQEVQSAYKMIQILGQILRNGTTSIEATTKKAIVHEVFRLSRRMLGKAFEGLEVEIDRWREDTRARVQAICDGREQEKKSNTEESPKRALAPAVVERKKKANELAVAVRADKEIIGVCWLAWFTVIKSVAEAVGARLLSKTYTKVVAEDNAIPNRMFALTISMDHDRDFPIKEAEDLYKDVRGSWFAQSLLRSLVAHHFYLYRESIPVQQKVCARLGIGIQKRLLLDDRKAKTLPSVRGKKDRRR